MARVYAAKAMTLLAFDKLRISQSANSVLATVGKNVTHDELSRLASDSQSVKLYFTDNWIYNLVVISLLNSQAVHFFRDSDLQVDGDMKLSGFYQCMPNTESREGLSEIWINIELPPFDLAATLSHEITHLFRDKFGPSEIQLSEHSLVLDEGLANVYAGFLQRDLHRYYSFRDTSQKFLSVLSSLVQFRLPEFEELYDHYKLQEDLSFYSPNGSLNQIWRFLGAGRHGHEAEYNSTWRTFIGESFLRKSSRLSWDSEATKSEFEGHHRHIFAQVKKAYFDEALTKSDIFQLDPETLDIEAEPLAAFLQTTQIPVMNSVTDAEVSSGVYVMGGVRISGTQHSFMYNPRSFLEKLSQIKNSLAKISPHCQAFQELYASGRVRNFLGFRVSDLRNQFVFLKGRRRTSTDGGKPGVPIRACIPWSKDF